MKKRKLKKEMKAKQYKFRKEQISKLQLSLTIRNCNYQY